jgi:hypothetical protein
MLATGKRCYVPLVKDKASNMQLLHIGVWVLERRQLIT